MNTLDPCPFRLDSVRAYREWRARKLDGYPTGIAELQVPVADLAAPSPDEHAAVLEACRRANLAVVSTRPGAVDKSVIRAFGRHFGLHALDANLHADDDGVSALQVAEAGGRRDYVPYTNRALNWHTDGYYNEPGRWVRAFIIFCAQDAVEGGENQLLDHEIAYILLRDENPEHIRAFMAADAMTIPPRLEDGEVARAAQAGPVFSVHPDGHLHMRYTARTVSIEWHDDPATKGAVAALERLLADAASPYVFRGRLEPGMGLVSNNVLHDRAAFTDDATHKRHYYRARYFDRLAGTGIADVYQL